MNWFSKIFKPSKSEDPKHTYSVVDTGSEIILSHFDKEVSRIAWTDIVNISILTTDEGPELPDVFWRFRTKDEKLVFPQTADGEQAVAEKAMSLSVFDSEKFISAMCCAENHEFLVWKRNETCTTTDGH